MKKIMYEIAGIALLCSTCIGTVNAEEAVPDNTEEMELDDLDLQDSEVDKINAEVKGVQKLGKKLMETSKKEPEVKDEGEPSEESKVKDETNESEVKEDKTQKPEELNKEETKDEAQKPEEPETKDETNESEVKEDKTQKPEEPETKGETNESEVKEDKTQKPEEPEIKDETNEKREANEQQQDLGLADMFGDDSSTQTSNEQSSGAILPSISEEDLKRDIANEFDKKLESYLEQQKKLSELQKNLSEQYKKLSEELSKLPEGSATQSKIAEIHKSLTNTKCDLSELKSKLSQRDEKFNDEELDHSKFEEIWKNLDAQRKLLDDQLDARSKLSNEVGQFAVNLGGLKETLTRIDKLLEDLGVVKDALTEINKTDYSELFSVAKSQGPNIYNEQQKELEKTRTLWKNHESAVLRKEAIAKGEKHHEKEQKEPKAPFDGSAVDGLSEIVEQARKELDVLELSKDAFTKSSILNGTDWSLYADKFDVNKVEFPNNKNGLATEINKELGNFVKLNNSITGQPDLIVSDENQIEGLRIMKRLMKLLSSFGKLDLTDQDRSMKLLGTVEELLGLTDKVKKVINVKELKVVSFGKSIPTMNKLKTAKEDEKPLVDAVNKKLSEFNEWISSTKDKQPTAKNKKGNPLISKNDQFKGLTLVNELEEALTNLKNGLNEAVKNSEPKTPEKPMKKKKVKKQKVKSK